MIHLSVQTASDFSTLVNRLEAEGIPNLISARQDSAFPALDTVQNYGVIRVSSADKAALTRVLEDLPLEVEILEVEDEAMENTSRKNPNYLAILLGIGLALCLLAYLRVQRILSRSAEDKNYWYEWNASGTTLEMVGKSSGIVYSRYSDSNFDLNYEKAETFLFRDVPSSVSYDYDEDGFFDEVVYYDRNGQYTGASKDLSGLKIMDYMEFLLDSGDTLRFEDKNENGVWELVPEQ